MEWQIIKRRAKKNMGISEYHRAFVYSPRADATTIFPIENNIEIGTKRKAAIMEYPVHRPMEWLSKTIKLKSDTQKIHGKTRLNRKIQNQTKNLDRV